MARRWYVVLVCLVLVSGGAYTLSSRAAPAYQSTATVVLLPPAAVVTAEGNPYLFMGGLDQALSILAVKLNSAEVAQPLTSGGETYEVVKDPSGAGPLVRITAEAPSAEASEQVRDAVLEQLPIHLRELQARLGVAENSQITAMTIVQSDVPAVSMKEQLRMLLAACAVGLALTAGIVRAVDQWMLARAARRQADAVPEEPEFETERFLDPPLLTTRP